MLSALFTSVADALISYAIDKLDPAERIKSWLRLDPARLAFKKALARAYSAFARQYPEYTSSLFDQSFLSTDALPELSKLLTRNQHPDPALLAQAWGRSLGAGVDFAQAATKPAAYFLERFNAELKAEPALQSIFDSRAVESLPKLEAEIQKLSTDLQRGLDEALKAATDYQKVTLHITGDVKDSNIIIGDNNVINKFYYSGDFVSLNEYYIPPDGVFQRVRVDEFIGRDWLTSKVDAFLNDPNRKSGAFLLVGDAGVGKTSFMAHLVKERRYLHLFAEQAPGQAMLQRAMQSLGSQLVTRYQIDPYKDRDTLNALSVFPDFLERILRLAASTLTEGEKIVIVCDALDEAGVFPDHFVFGLPKELPDGVYFILSQRPVNVKLPNFEPVIEHLEAQGEGNLQDIESYLSAVAKRPEVAGQIRSKEYSEDFFIQTLKDKSQGVWMYLHYIIKEIESGARAPLDLANLPTGLVGYYAEYWDSWRTGKRGKGEEAWDELYAPLLTTLAAAQEAIPVDWLIRWADVTAKPREATRLLMENWRAFITEKEVNGQKTYTPYHLSLKDFIIGRVDTDKLPPAQANLVKDLATQTVDAHKRIVSVFEKECNGEWEKLVEQDYPRLHLTAHLNSAGEYEKLRMMLTEGDEKIKWAEAREKKEDAYTGYINDLIYVWEYAEREQNFSLAIRCMFIENSIHAISQTISVTLMTALVEVGLWSYLKCIGALSLHTNPYRVAEAIEKIAPTIPERLVPSVINIIQSLEIGVPKVRAIAALIPYLNATQKKQLLDAAFYSAIEIINQREKIYSLKEIIPHLNEDYKNNILGFIKEKTGLNYQLSTIPELLNAYSKEIQENIAKELFDNIKNRDDISETAYIITKLTQFLPNENKLYSIKRARKIAQKEKNAYLFFSVAQILEENERLEFLEQSLEEAINIPLDDFKRYTLISELASNLPLKINEGFLEQEITNAARNLIPGQFSYVVGRLLPVLSKNLIKKVLFEARQVSDLQDRAKILTKLLPYLGDEIKEVLMEIKAVAGITLALFPYINQEEKIIALNKLLFESKKINDVSNFCQFILSLINYLNNTQRGKSINTAKKIFFSALRESTPSTKMLSDISPFLNKKDFSEIMKNIDKYDRTTILIMIVCLLPNFKNEEMVEYAFSLAQDIGDELMRCQAYIDILPYVPDELKHQVQRKVITEIYSMDTSPLYKRILLEQLIPLIDDLLLAEILNANDLFSDEISPILLNIKLIPRLEGELKKQIIIKTLDLLDKVDGISFRIHQLIELINLVDEKTKTQIVDSIFSQIQFVTDASTRAFFLAKIIIVQKDFSGTLFQELTIMTNALESKIERGKIYMVLLPYFEEKERISKLKEYAFVSEELFENSMNLWKDLNFVGLEELLFPLMRTYSKYSRPDVYRKITTLTPALVHFRGPEIADELYRTITDVTRWWP